MFGVDSSNTREIGGTASGLRSRGRSRTHVTGATASSVEAEGSTFWFELQYGEVRRARRILVVEHDPSVASLISEYLTGGGYVVEIVASGEEPLERVSEDPPLLVTLDAIAGRRVT